MSAVPNEAAKVTGWMRKLGQRHSHKLPGQVGHAGNHANTAVHRSLQNNNSSRLVKISGLKTEWSTAPVGAYSNERWRPAGPLECTQSGAQPPYCLLIVSPQETG